MQFVIGGALRSHGPKNFGSVDVQSLTLRSPSSTKWSTSSFSLRIRSDRLELGGAMVSAKDGPRNAFLRLLPVHGAMLVLLIAGLVFESVVGNVARGTPARNCCFFVQVASLYSGRRLVRILHKVNAHYSCFGVGVCKQSGKCEVLNCSHRKECCMHMRTGKSTTYCMFDIMSGEPLHNEDWRLEG